VDNATDAIFIVQDDTIKFANPRTLEILGYENEAFPLLPTRTSSIPRIADRSWIRIGGGWPEKKNLPVSSSFRMINRGGREFIVELNAVRITWEGRTATLNFVRDITDQKNMEASLPTSAKDGGNRHLGRRYRT
jgi:two-component system cell cycle sensor histidine kinase/response regulator CckA